MRRLLAAAAAVSLTVGAAALADAAYTPLCVTVPPNQGWFWVANQFVPGITGPARDAFILRLQAGEDDASLRSGQRVCADPNDPAFPTTTTTGVPPSTSTTVPPTSTAPSTTVEPTTTATAVPTTTTSPTTSSSTTTPTTSTVTPTTQPGHVHPIANIPSNFDVPSFLHNCDTILPITPSCPIQSTELEPSGNFRTICVPSHLAHDDPIVNPGTNSAHLHLFFGNTQANRHSTYSSLRTTGASTCEGGPINRTGYWMPAMFDGQGRVIPPNLILLYYKAGDDGYGTLAQRQAQIKDTQPLPNGLRIVAGAPGGHIGWQCGDGSNQGTVIPNSCPNGYLIASVAFPDCWDGVNLDSPNHRSHMAYRSYVNGQYICPPGYPVDLPSITEAFHWSNGATDIGQWSLSSDMGAARGSTLHADWFGAWDVPTMMRWHNACLIGMRTSNNGNLCDGQALSGVVWTGAITSTARISGWTPMSQ